MPDCTFELVVATDRAFKETVARIDGIAEAHATLPDVCTADGTYYWKVLTVRGDEKVDNRGGPRSFRVDHAAPHAFFVVREDGLMAASALDGNAAPSFGVCETESGIAPAPDRFGTPGGAVALDGKTGGLRYAIPFFPGTNYSFHAWVCPEGLPTKGLQQVFSAWCRGLDDPLRVTFDGDSLFARLEAGGSYGTAGVPMQNGEWIHAAAVKQGGKLTLYVNGQPAQSAQVPERVFSESMLIGIGYNPLYPAGERFIGKISDFALYAKALAAEDVVRMCETNEQ
ncbi:MAG TPA: LamG domain-containing protein [Candidatus Hydrogenedentes bacterium]|nr:LamG domain-containing protein [Candidatus Hydrogenedentota bacterium]